MFAAQSQGIGGVRAGIRTGFTSSEQLSFGTQREGADGFCSSLAGWPVQRFSNCGAHPSSGVQRNIWGARSNARWLGPAPYGGAWRGSVTFPSDSAQGRPARGSVSTSAEAALIYVPSSLHSQHWLRPQRPSHAPPPTGNLRWGGTTKTCD